MRSPSVLRLPESSLGADVPSIDGLKSSVCSEENRNLTNLTTEPDMESCFGKAILKTCNNVIEKESSGSDSDNDFVVPDSELVLKIVSQVESYFSDENLIKDEFILKHIRRNRDGFISLKLLSSFRKVKVLTKNWKVVAHCVKVGSKQLELNETESKIRRKAPLPALEGDKYSRTLIAYNFTAGTDNIDNISKVFSKFGDIALIRILKNSSSNLLTNINNKYDLNGTAVATIEFNNKSDAENALKCMETNKSNNWRNSIEVMPMKSSLAKPIKTYAKYDNSFENRENQRNGYFKKAFKPNSSQRPIFMRQKSKSCSGDEIRFSDRFASKPVIRERSSTQIDSNSINSLKLPANVIRLPKGPDGTNGFTQK